MNVSFPRHWDTAFLGAGKQLSRRRDTALPSAGKTYTLFSSILNESDLSPAPGNGAGAQLPPAQGKPTHFSPILTRRRETAFSAQFPPAPGKPILSLQPCSGTSSEPRSRIFRRRDTASPGAGKTNTFFFDSE